MRPRLRPVAAEPGAKAEQETRDMIVIVVGQSKGGVGKTTVAVNLAGDIVRYGSSVAVVDADPQGGASHWSRPRQLSFPVRHHVLTTLNKLVWIRNVLKTGSDVVVVDLPAGLGPIFETAVMIADLLVVPCGPSSLDIGGAEGTIARAREVKRSDASGAPLKIVCVPMRVDSSHEEGSQIVDALSELGETVGPSLSCNVAFVRCFAAGVTVSSDQGAESAAEEVAQLSRFLLKQTKPQQNHVARS